ncbi:MAG TPA: MFS transporter [Actinobacteria bacterium]|nr:MFS transporter [Actinomycetota bacterium]
MAQDTAAIPTGQLWENPKVYNRRWLIMLTLVSGLIIVILDNTILNVALPSISRQLGASQGQLTGAILSYAVVFGSFQFTAGVLGDRWGRRRVFLTGLLIFGVTSLAASQSKDPTQLIFWRAGMAVGAALITPQTLSILTNVFPPKERGRAIGIWAGCTGASLSLGPVLGGLLLDHFWWGSIFFINVPIVVVTIAATIVLVPESLNPNAGRFDPIGLVLSVVGLGSLIFGLVYGGESRDWSSFLSTGMIVAGLLVLVAFIAVEARLASPSFDVRFFKNPRFSAASIATAFGFFALFGVTFFLTFYFQFVKGLSPLQAGLAALPSGLGQVIFAPRAPKLVARIGPKFTIAGGLTLLAISLGLYTTVNPGDPVWHVFIISFLTGTGLAHVVAPSTESVMSSLPPQNAGAGAAVNNTTRQVSGALGIAVFGTLLQVFYARNIANALEVLPETFRDEARKSIGDTFVAVQRLGVVDPKAAGQAARELFCGAGRACASGQAFVAGVHITSIIACTSALIGAAIVLRYLPRRSAPDAGYLRQQRMSGEAPEATDTAASAASDSVS